MFPLANQYSYSNSYGWSNPGNSFNDVLQNVHANSSSAYGALPNYGFQQAPYGNGYGQSPKSMPDPAYAALYANSYSGYWGSQQAFTPQGYSYDAKSEGGYSNSVGSKQPEGSTPPDDLYSWSNDAPKDEKKHRRKREKHENNESNEKPEEPKKPRRNVTGSIIGDPVFNGADGEKYKIAGVAGKVYNLFSDKHVQVNGKFTEFTSAADGSKGHAVTEMGFVTQNNKATIKINPANAAFTIEVDGKNYDAKKSFTQGDISWDAKTKQLKVKAPGEDGEKWDFTVSYKANNTTTKTRWLNLGVEGSNIIKDDYTTTGLWGHSFDGKKSDVDYKDGTGGGGVLRKSDGSVLDKSVQGAEYDKALKGYEMDSLIDTSGGWSVY